MFKTESTKIKSGYLYSIFGGLGLYFLKFLSLKVLINNVSMDSYPLALILSGLFIFTLNQINKKYDSSYFLNTFYVIVAVTVIVINQQYSISFSNELFKTVFASFSFAFLITTSQFAEMILKEITINRSNTIKNAQYINKLILFEEIGILAAACAVVSLESSVSTSIMLTVGLFPLVIMVASTTLSKHDKESSKVKESEQYKSIFSYSFSLYAVLLLSTIFLIKQLYSYGAYIGFKELSQSGYSFETLFASINIIQTLCVFGIIGGKIILQKRNISWNSGLKLFLNAQFLTFLALILASSPILLVSASALRKTLTHTILNESLKLLNLNYPQHLRNKIQHITSSYAGLCSYFIVGALAYMVSNQYINLSSIWIFAIACTCFAVFLRKKLFNALLEFQITNILQKNVYEAVNSCHSLANKEASIYAQSLGSILLKSPRPMLTKAIIYTLGEMQNPISIDLLIRRFDETDREDIQVAIIQALIKYKSHDVDLFLIECLENMILNQVSLGEIRRSIFESITSKVQDIAIPMSLKLLKNNADNPRVIANAVLIIGDLASHKNDESLYKLLLSYTDKKYSRRIRSNAFLSIYKYKKLREHAMAGISSFIFSSDEFDRSAASFLAGELNLKGMSYFVRQQSFESNHCNSTIEVSLLKLGDEYAAKSVANIIFSDDKSGSTVCLNQLNSINSDQVRYKVYNYIISEMPERLGAFMKLLSESKRNFDDDRRKIYETAKQQNISINDREFIYEVETVKYQVKAA
jgi:hypothetical protein